MMQGLRIEKIKKKKKKNRWEKVQHQSMSKAPDQIKLTGKKGEKR